MNNYNGFKAISVCEVTEADYSGQCWLLRLADLDDDGKIIPFQRDMDYLGKFENRDKLYYNRATEDPGTVAIWEWEAIPNLNDASKDYITTEHMSNMELTEIIVMKSCKSIEDIVESLKSGVFETITTNNVIFAYPESEKLIGILCRKNMLLMQETSVRLKEDINAVDIYRLSIHERIYLSNNKMYYWSIYLREANQTISTKQPLEIVKSIILDDNTWPVFKKAGKTKKEWKVIKNFLSQLETESLVKKVALQLNCSDQEAEQYVKKFIEHAGVYVDGKSFEDEVLEAAICSNEELLERCRQLNFAEWKAENEENCRKAEKRISDLKEQEEEAEKDLQKLQNLLSEKEELLTQLESKEKLFADAEEKVQKKIKGMQEETAELMADFIVLQPLLQTNGTNVEQPKAEETITPEIEILHYQYGQEIECETSDLLTDWNDAVLELGYGLFDAGVAEEYTDSLAAYLYASYILNSPLLLVGPNASEIADVFSLTLFGQTAGILDCNYAYNEADVSNCLYSGDPVVKINNPFENNWIVRLPEIVSHSEPYFMAVYPYPEDVQIEPKSLYNYLFPLFTEMLVDKPPVEFKFSGGMSSDFNDFKIVKAGSTGLSGVLKDLHMNALLKNRIQTVISNMRAMMSDGKSDPDSEILFTLLPYAAATMQMPALLDALNEKQNLHVSNALTDQINSLYGA